MPSPRPTSGFDETKHPRGQPDNAGKFKSRTLPEPPPARRRPTKEVEPSDDAMALAAGLSWDEMVVELGDQNEVEVDGPDPLDEEWEGKTCIACKLPMNNPDSDLVESLTIETTAGRVLHWHPSCWMNPTDDTTREFREKAGFPAS